MSKDFSYKLIYLNFILACLIVYTHAYNIGYYTSVGNLVFLIESLINGLSDFAVPTFFIISGFLFFQNYDSTKMLKKIKSRIKSLLFPLTNPYAPFNMIPCNLSDFIEKVLNSNGPLWYVEYLMIFIIITLIFAPLLKKKKGVLIVIIIPFLGLYLESIYGTFGFGRSLSQNYIYYLFGSYLAFNYKKELFELKFSNKTIIISLILFICLILSRVYVYDYYSNVFLSYIYTFIGIILEWIIFDYFRKFNKVNWFLKQSFFIYCMHNMILESIEKVLFIIFKDTWYGALLDFIFAPILTIILIFIMSKFLNKNYNKFYSLITGGRGA